MPHWSISIGVCCALLLVWSGAAHWQALERSHCAVLPLSAVQCRAEIMDVAPMEQRLLCGLGVRLNAGDEAELQFLPGIGPARARAIVQHRNAHGAFQHPDEVMQIRGIGPKTRAGMSPWLSPLH
ncbi:MAG: helix-hairpin-helix domain-containing protein [Proteobacteria bacterium]|jgi:competence ComEA-like helix-hairpin-helix protein|nr:helix-hairpin-helix domain-containing protein [Pseudomonadota bacterium]